MVYIPKLYDAEMFFEALAYIGITIGISAEILSAKPLLSASAAFLFTVGIITHASLLRYNNYAYLRRVGGYSHEKNPLIILYFSTFASISQGVISAILVMNRIVELPFVFITSLILAIILYIAIGRKNFIVKH